MYDNNNNLILLVTANNLKELENTYLQFLICEYFL